MDVRCSRCATEYELDDSRVGPAGTPVQCSNCGHVFKVMPGGVSREATTPGTPKPTSETAQPVPDEALSAAPDWTLRRADGGTLRFREMTTLQKWIVERKVGRDHEISRSGRTWKRLGDIAELTSFFQVVEAADAAQRAAAPVPVAVVDAPAARFASLIGDGAPSPAPTSPSSPGTTAPGTTGPGPAAFSPARAPSGATAAVADNGLPYLDDNDPVLHWQRRRRSFTVAATAAVVAVAVVVVVLNVVPATPTLPEPLRVQAAAAVAAEDDAARAAAIAALAAETAPAARAWSARLLAARAVAAGDLARLAERGRALDPTLDVERVVGDARVRLDEAVAATVTLRGDPEHHDTVHLAEAAVALARGDTAALTRAVGEARQRLAERERAAVDEELRLLLTLAEARALDPTAPGAVDALVATQAKLALFADDRARAAAAVAAVAHVVVVVAAQRQSTPSVAVPPAEQFAAAQTLLQPLAASDPRRVLADKLLNLASTPPPPPPPPAIVDGAGGALPSVVDDKPAAALPADYDGWMRRGEQALVADRSQTAFDSFKRASALRPEVARPWLKLGWSALDTSRVVEAERAFGKALALDPALAEAQFGLAEALRFAGRKTDALDAYRAYVAMDPSGRDAAIARRVIEELQ
ncbi:MAG: tetratricopeptide repeat protein [Deltaproteobacteria bacterium]|nr:tetratricopeptide repeat protein [Deltaproteobacteria bacterium]